MDAIKHLESRKGGFSFDLCERNARFEKDNIHPPRTMKTGTTIVGLVYQDGVVLGADTRATEGPIVCDKNCIKIHKISKNIWCCGAGTSADTESVTGLVGSQLELHRLATGTEPRVVTALTRLKQHLFKYQGHVSAALVLCGIDTTGAYLHTVYPHGSTDSLPYATMGSGSLAAMAVFEANYRDNHDEKQAVELVNEAIQSGIFNDLGSGGNVDIAIISKTNGFQWLRNYQTPNNRKYHRKFPQFYQFPRGTTQIISQKTTPHFTQHTTAQDGNQSSKMEI